MRSQHQAPRCVYSSRRSKFMNNIKHSIMKYVLIGLMAGATCFTGLTQAASDPGQSLSCLKLSRIKDVDILDNEHIVFRTGLNDYYLNKLPYACNGLKINDAFLYRTSINEICDLDMIKVLDK